MASSRSGQEVEDDYRQSMGPELGPLFHALYLELTWTHWRWKQYRELFGDKAGRIELLNASASLFFGIVQQVFFEDTLLSIARLTGPAATMNKSNLSIERLPALMSDKQLKEEVRQLVEAAQNAASLARDWRNRHLAHRDLDLVLGGASPPLEPAAREGVENALRSLRRLMNVIQLAYSKSEVGYELSATVHGAEALLYVIRDGLRFEAEKQERWDRGDFHTDDLNPPGPI